MLVSFSKNIFLQLYCRIENKIINIDGKRWRNGRHKCRCHVCGKVLDSKKDKYSPKECGWMRLKDRKIYDPWICHSCLEHYKHGKWNVLDDCSNAGVYCSECGKKVYRSDYANQKVQSNFCPNCGAKMDAI